MKRLLNTSLPIVVLTAGLISCSQEKPDDWAARAPTVKSAHHGGRIIDIHSNFGGELPADSVFTFPSDNGEVRNIQVESSCALDRADLSANVPSAIANANVPSAIANANLPSAIANASFTQRRTFDYGLSIPLSSLIPDDILLAFPSTDLSCEFNFTLADNAKSTATFSLKNVKVMDLALLENAPLVKSTFSAAELESLDLAFDLPDPARSEGARSLYALACEEFQNTRTSQDGLARHELVRALIEDEIRQGGRLTRLDGDAKDSRFSNSVQTCRIVVLNQVPGKKTDIVVSSSFRLSFAVSQPEVQISPTERFQHDTNLRGLTLVSIEVTNADPVPVAYLVSGDRQRFLALTFGSENLSNMVWQKIPGTDVPGRLAVRTKNQNWPTAHGLVVEVPAYGNASLELYVETNFDCTNQAIPISPTQCLPDGTNCRQMGGLGLALAEDLRLSRLASWHGSPISNRLETMNAETVLPTGYQISALTDLEIHLRETHEYPSAPTQSPSGPYAAWKRPICRY